MGFLSWSLIACTLSVQQSWAQEDAEPAIYEEAPSDDEMLEQLEEDLEKSILEKHEIELQAKKKRDQLKLPPNSPGSRKPVDPPILERMEDLHTELSDDIVGIADNIDAFFVNDPFVEGRNKTNAKINNSFIFLEDEGFRNDFDFKFRLRLPQLKEKLSLEFDDDFDETELSNENNRRAQILNTQRNSGSRGGLSYYETLKGFSTKLTGGIEYNHGLIGYWRFRVNRNFILSKNQKITFLHDYFDDTRDRKGQTAIINYDYSFTKQLVFRIVNEETYRDEFNTFETWHGLTLYHQLNEKNFMSYDYRIRSVNPAGRDTFYLDLHTASIVYRRLLYRKHLYGEVGPAIFFPKEKKFEGLVGITFKIELIVGNI